MVKFIDDRTWIGFLWGLAVPFVGYALLLVFHEYLQESGWLGNAPDQPIFRTRTLLLFAVCLNLIPFTVFQRRRMNQAMRGAVAATLLGSIVWLVVFGNSLS